VAQERNRPDEGNTVAMLGAAYSLLGFDVVDGVVGSGYPIKPNHSAVFGQIRLEGSRLTELARKANITPQSMGKIVDELEHMGYVERTPDPADRRAKLIRLTASGSKALQAGVATIEGIEDRLVGLLGSRDYRTLRRILAKIIADGPRV
jgi:DNA-binding MarR family transcriptional regulator